MRQIEAVLHAWKRIHPQQLCHIIALDSDRDGKMLPLPDALADYGLTAGAILILIPDRLAYYLSERSNLNRQPFYVLFKP